MWCVVHDTAIAGCELHVKHACVRAYNAIVIECVHRRKRAVQRGELRSGRRERGEGGEGRVVELQGAMAAENSIRDTRSSRYTCGWYTNAFFALPPAPARPARPAGRAADDLSRSQIYTSTTITTTTVAKERLRLTQSVERIKGALSSVLYSLLTVRCSILAAVRIIIKFIMFSGLSQSP